MKFVFFSQFSSDEVVTAAQHLYEMVSFYFDDLGKLLLDDILTSLYGLLVEFHCFLSPALFYSYPSYLQIRSSRHPAGVHPGLQADPPHPCRSV